MADRQTIGDRWTEIHERLVVVLDFEPLLTDSERGFVEGLLERLANFKDRTYISVAQLNWLTNIEAKVQRERGFGQ